jgi:hypothetical protein
VSWADTAAVQHNTAAATDSVLFKRRESVRISMNTKYKGESSSSQVIKLI